MMNKLMAHRVITSAAGLVMLVITVGAGQKF
jgi:hypothetical protein